MVILAPLLLDAVCTIIRPLVAVVSPTTLPATFSFLANAQSRRLELRGPDTTSCRRVRERVWRVVGALYCVDCQIRIKRSPEVVQDQVTVEAVTRRLVSAAPRVSAYVGTYSTVVVVT
jgi:hypothetical protein